MKKNKILMMLLSLVVGFGLWTYVITQVDPAGEDTYYNIPVSYDGEGLLEERGLMLMPGGDTSVTLRLAGNRTDLIKLNPGNITVRADLSNISKAGEFPLTYSIYYPGDIPSGAITVQSRSPSMVKVMVSRRLSAEVPVKVDYEGSVPESFIADKENAILDYSQIRVTGPAEIIEKIDQAVIRVNLSDRTESFLENCRYVLCDAEGNPVDVELVTTNVAEVQLQVKIQRMKSIPLTLTVIDGGGATQQTSKIEITPNTIQVSGSDTALESLTELKLGEVDLADIPHSTNLHFSIVLPESVTNLTGVEEAEVKISFPDLSTRKFQVNEIQPVNVPEGLEANILTEQLSVTVRGPKKAVAAMDGSEIKVRVDFSGGTIGASSWKAEITVEGSDGVGAVGAYSVSAALQEPVPVEETESEE